MGERERVKEVIAKLLALGDQQKNDSEAQVMAALKKARELMDKYQIEESEIQSESNANKIISQFMFVKNPKHASAGRYIKLPLWANVVAASMRAYFDVELILSKKYDVDFRGKPQIFDGFMVIGSEDDVVLFIQVYDYLTDQILSKGGLEDRAFEKHKQEMTAYEMFQFEKNKAGYGVSFCNSYMTGMTRGLTERFSMMQRERVGNQKMNGLVLNKKAKISDFIKENFHSLKDKEQKVRMNSSHRGAYFSGNADSKSVAFTKAIVNKQRLLK